MCNCDCSCPSWASAKPKSCLSCAICKPCQHTEYDCCQRSKSSESHKRCVQFKEEKFSNMIPPSFLCSYTDPKKKRPRSKSENCKVVLVCDDNFADKPAAAADTGAATDEAANVMLGNAEVGFDNPVYGPAAGYGEVGAAGMPIMQGYDPAALMGIPGYGAGGIITGPATAYDPMAGTTVLGYGPGYANGQLAVSGAPGYGPPQISGAPGYGPSNAAASAMPGYGQGYGNAQQAASGVPGYGPGQVAASAMPNYGPPAGSAMPGYGQSYGNAQPATSGMPGYGPPAGSGMPGYGQSYGNAQQAASGVPGYGPGQVAASGMPGYGPPAGSGMPGYGQSYGNAQQAASGVPGYGPGQVAASGMPGYGPPADNGMHSYARNQPAVSGIPGYGPGYGNTQAVFGAPGYGSVARQGVNTGLPGVGYGPAAAAADVPYGDNVRPAGLPSTRSPPFNPGTGEDLQSTFNPFTGQEKVSHGQRKQGAPQRSAYIDECPCPYPCPPCQPYPPCQSCQQCLQFPPCYIENGAGEAPAAALAKANEQCAMEKPQQPEVCNCGVPPEAIERFCKSLQIPCPPCAVKSCADPGCFLVIPMKSKTVKTTNNNNKANSTKRKLKKDGRDASSRYAAEDNMSNRNKSANANMDTCWIYCGGRDEANAMNGRDAGARDTSEDSRRNKRDQTSAYAQMDACCCMGGYGRDAANARNNKGAEESRRNKRDQPSSKGKSDACCCMRGYGRDADNGRNSKDAGARDATEDSRRYKRDQPSSKGKSDACCCMRGYGRDATNATNAAKATNVTKPGKDNDNSKGTFDCCAPISCCPQFDYYPEPNFCSEGCCQRAQANKFPEQSQTPIMSNHSMPVKSNQSPQSSVMPNSGNKQNGSGNSGCCCVQLGCYPQIWYPCCYYYPTGCCGQYNCCNPVYAACPNYSGNQGGNVQSQEASKSRCCGHCGAPLPKPTPKDNSQKRHSAGGIHNLSSTASDIYDRWLRKQLAGSCRCRAAATAHSRSTHTEESSAC